MLMISL